MYTRECMAMGDACVIDLFYIQYHNHRCKESGPVQLTRAMYVKDR